MKKVKLERFGTVEMIGVAVIFAFLGAWGAYLVSITNNCSPRIQDWYPELSWKDYKKKLHLKGKIETVYVKDGLLYVSAGGREICYGALEIEKGDKK